MHRARTDLLIPTLSEVWGYSALRPGQDVAIQAWAEGKEVIALLPTGGGKSMCYQLPALVERALGRGTTLVISPLIALMQDQVDSLMGRGVTAAALNSHLSRYEQEEVEAALEAELLDVLLVSPERAAKSQFRELIRGCQIALIAVDEAHCVSSWGHDFRPEYMRLDELREVVDAPVMALTATATPRVVSEIISGLAMRDCEVIRGDFARPNLHFSVSLENGKDARLEAIITLLEDKGMRGNTGESKAIIYCASRKKVETIAAELRSANFRVGFYHGGRNQDDRHKAQSAFEAGRTRVLVATNAFGMGIDYPDVRVIVHAQAPGSLEAYYQEAGRASRDGEPGYCLMFFSAGDMVLQRRLVRDAKDRSRSNEALAGLEAYAMSSRCRQELLCLHFSPDAEVAACGCCDLCTNGDAVVSALEEQRAAKLASIEALGDYELDIIVAAVANLRKPVGKTSLARALRGSKAKALRKYGLQNLPEHGALKARNELSICAAIDGLLRDRRLAPKGQKYPTVWLPNKPVRAGAKTTSKAGAKTSASRAGAATKASMRRGKAQGSNLHRALELYRSRTAKKLRWKPYMVMHNKVIAQIDEKRPKSLDELYEIDGLGPAKVEQFGYELLDIVRRYDH
ncbi:MAG: ATP-dependent DNA helicase RecQ [Myxococcales bacterium]|nr:ATP-dependent DNA helicase RecQ [Myxococcales bacterium]